MRPRTDQPNAGHADVSGSMYILAYRQPVIEELIIMGLPGSIRPPSPVHDTSQASGIYLGRAIKWPW